MDLAKNINLSGYVLINFVDMTIQEKELVRNWRNNEKIREWSFSNHIISIEEHKTFIEGLQENNTSYYWLAKKDTKENKYVGIISLNRLDFQNRNAYLGIYTDPEAHPSGVGYLLINILKTIAFEMINLHTLKLEVIEGNTKAIHFYKKSGFTEEGRLKEFIFKNNRWHDVIVMGILKGN